MQYDVAIIGAGIIGLSTAWQLQQRWPDKQIVVLEKESDLARHQTGHNSGVIHAGVYYTPGSLKADFCRQGLFETIAFCRQHDIPYQQCGKLLVATNQIEYARMLRLYQRCQQNRIDSELLTQQQLHQREPHINGIGAIHVPATGIVSYTEICRKLAILFQQRGGCVELNSTVHAIRENDAGITLSTRQGDIHAKLLVSCAGLQADRITRMHGLQTGFQIIPVRGEYYRLSKHLSGIIHHLIYPIPDPALPFLGIHLTRMIDGSITVGPNAVPGFKREGYGRVNFSLRDTAAMVTYPGFWKLARANIGSAVAEIKNSFSKNVYLRQVQKYCPIITIHDLLPYPAGIRAQAVLEDGSLGQDFLFVESPRSLHVCNAPSPAATAALPIGGYLCSRLAEKL